MFRSTITLVAALAAAPAFAQDAPEAAAWSAGISAGTTMLEGAGDQPFVSLSLTRDLGPAYVRLTGTLIESNDDEASRGLLPARTLTATLAGGYAFGDLSLDGYASLGTREFDTGFARGRNGQQLSVESEGSTAGVGLALTYELALGSNWFAAPSVSVDYSSIDVSRVVAVPGRDPVTARIKEEGVTGVAGLSLQHLFGDGASSAGLYGAFVTTSNSAAQQRGISPSGAERIVRTAPVEGSSASWAEYGASASIALGGRVMLDASILRTAGFPQSEITTLSAGVTIDF